MTGTPSVFYKWLINRYFPKNFAKLFKQLFFPWELLLSESKKLETKMSKCQILAPWNASQKNQMNKWNFFENWLEMPLESKTWDSRFEQKISRLLKVNSNTELLSSIFQKLLTKRIFRSENKNVCLIRFKTSTSFYLYSWIQLSCLKAANPVESDRLHLIIKFPRILGIHY